MKLKALLLFFIVAAVAAIGDASAASLAGSWRTNSGSLLTFSKITPDKYTLVLSLANTPYADFADLGITVTQISNFHGLVVFDSDTHATFTAYGQLLNAEGYSEPAATWGLHPRNLSMKVSGEQTFVTNNKILFTNLVSCILPQQAHPSLCEAIPDDAAFRIFNN